MLNPQSLLLACIIAAVLGAVWVWVTFRGDIG